MQGGTQVNSYQNEIKEFNTQALSDFLSFGVIPNTSRSSDPGLVLAGSPKHSAPTSISMVLTKLEAAIEDTAAALLIGSASIAVLDDGSISSNSINAVIADVAGSRLVRFVLGNDHHLPISRRKVYSDRGTVISLQEDIDAGRLVSSLEGLIARMPQPFASPALLSSAAMLSVWGATPITLCLSVGGDYLEQPFVRPAIFAPFKRLVFGSPNLCPAATQFARGAILTAPDKMELLNPRLLGDGAIFDSYTRLADLSGLNRNNPDPKQVWRAVRRAFLDDRDSEYEQALCAGTSIRCVFPLLDQRVLDLMSDSMGQDLAPHSLMRRFALRVATRRGGQAARLWGAPRLQRSENSRYLSTMLRTHLREYAGAVLTSDQSWLSRRGVTKLWDRHLSGSDNGELLWRLIVLLRWLALACIPHTQPAAEA